MNFLLFFELVFFLNTKLKDRKKIIITVELSCILDSVLKHPLKDLARPFLTTCVLFGTES